MQDGLARVFLDDAKLPVIGKQMYSRNVHSFFTCIIMGLWFSFPYHWNGHLFYRAYREDRRGRRWWHTKTSHYDLNQEGMAGLSIALFTRGQQAHCSCLPASFMHNTNQTLWTLVPETLEGKDLILFPWFLSSWTQEIIKTFSIDTPLIPTRESVVVDDDQASSNSDDSNAENRDVPQPSTSRASNRKKQKRKHKWLSGFLVSK